MDLRGWDRVGKADPQFRLGPERRVRVRRKGSGWGPTVRGAELHQGVWLPEAPSPDGFTPGTSLTR